MSSASNTLGRIRLEKVATGKGTRLEVRATTSGESVRIDPLGLERLSWQDIESEIASDNANAQAPDAGITAYSFGEPVSLPHDMQLRNEYALVDVSIEDRTVEITARNWDIRFSCHSEDWSGWLIRIRTYSLRSSSIHSAQIPESGTPGVDSEGMTVC